MPSASALWQQLQAQRADAAVKAEQGRAYDRHLKQLVQQLEKTDVKTLAAKHKDGTESLDHLNPFQDTLPFLFTLLACIRDASVKGSTIPDALRPGSDLWKKLARFLVEFDPIEVRYAGQEWSRLVQYMGQSMSLAPLETAQPCIAIMGKAVLRMDASGGTLTTLHVELLTWCLESQTYSQASELLASPVQNIPSKPGSLDGKVLCAPYLTSSTFVSVDSGLTGPVDVVTVQKYYLLGAMVSIGTKDWANSAHLLEYVLCTPTSGTVNIYMIEAYKKWLLVSLLLRGSSGSLPRIVSNAASKSIKSVGKAYESISDAFKLPASNKLVAEIHEAHQELERDANIGLAQLVVEHHQKLAVSKLQKVYAAVPVSMVASQFSMSEAKATEYAKQLIEEGMLTAVLEKSASSSDLILRFASATDDASDVLSDEQLHKELVAKAVRIKALDEQVAELDRRLSITKEYVDHTRKARKNKDRDGADMDAADVTLGGPDDDEHLMTDA